MKKSKRYVRICAALLCAVLCLSVNVAPAMAAKVTQADIDALKGNAASLDKKQKEIQSKLNSLKNDKAAAVQKKTLLDDQIANTNAKISNTEAQISDYNALISQAETELADAQQREEAQYELFCRRVRDMEERGTVSYWSVLFKATSFSDMLSRLDVVNEIMEADQRVIGQFCQLKMDMLHLGRCAITGYLFMLPEDYYKHDVGHDICSIHLFHQLIANRCGTVLMPYGRIASEKFWLPINI